MKQTEFNMLFESNDLIEELLIFAQKRHKILSIELMNSGYDDCIGFIELINESMCKTQEINEFGKYDGISIVNLSDITQISCDDTDNRTRMTLYELRQSALHQADSWKTTRELAQKALSEFSDAYAIPNLYWCITLQ